MMPIINVEVCTGCGECVSECHVGALAVVDRLVQMVYPDLCDYCSDCENICPSGAIECPFEIVLE